MTAAAYAERPARTRTRVGWRRLRPVVAAAVLAVVVWRVGTGPFLDGLRTVDAGALAAAAGLAVLTTVCCAWRWRVVARGFGVELPFATAVAAYYRSIFLNLTLPGGVVGDVHRGVDHGLRAVVWERAAGQVVQVVLTVALLLVLPSPVHAAMPYVAIALLAAGAVVLAARPRLVVTGAWPVIVVASTVIVAGHVVTFMIAARTAGATAPASELLPLALLVLAAGALPNVGGWGPREGVTAWAFAAAGMGASLGVAAAVVYGVMALAAALPGAAVLAAGTLGARRA